MKIAVQVSACALVALVSTAAAEVPIADFARPPEVYDASISPDGKTIVAKVPVDGQIDLIFMDASDLSRKVLRPRERDDIDGFWWAAPDRLIYNEGLHIGGEDRPVGTGELYTVKGDGTGTTILYGMRAGGPSVASHIARVEKEAGTGTFIASIPGDPNHALIATAGWNGPQHAQDTLGAFPELFRIDLRDGTKNRVGSSPMRNAYFLADHKGNVRFAYGNDNDFKERVWYRGADGGDWKLVYEEGKSDEKLWPLMFDRTGDNVYTACSGGGHGAGVCRWNVATQKQTLLWAAKDTDSFELVPTFDELDAFAIRSYPGRVAVSLIDKNAPEAKLLVELMKQFPGEDVRLTSTSADGKRVLALVEADTDPGVLYYYNAETKKSIPIFQKRSWIHPAQMASVEPIELKSRDGLALHGYLTHPLGKETAKQQPLVVYVHGGPYFQRDSWTFDPTAQLLASRGYTVLQVNFRGSGGYGREFELAGYREWGGKMQDDVTDATRWAIAQGTADSQRICIYGVSYGGYAALEGAVKEPDLYKCAIGDAGVYDLRLMYSRGATQQTLFGENFLKTVLGENADELYDRSPIAHLDKLKASVMLIVGGADNRVPPVHGENLHNALEQRHIAHEWLYERTEGHGFYDPKHVEEMYTKLLAFLDRNIGAGRSASVAGTR
ncbi:MAG TPA: S9 family peptidase [Rudaea sp.]|nr:S9 family peptidase [Rudaea sp.]